MSKKNAQTDTLKELDVVALLADAPEHNLARGQVGTIVMDLDKNTALVEFVDNSGATYALESLAKSLLLPLIHESRAA